MKKRAIIIITITFMLFSVIAIGIAIFSLRNKKEAMERIIEDKLLTTAERLELGEKYLLELDYQQAMVQLQIVIDVEPRNVRAYLGVVDAYLHLDEIQDAVEWLTTGIKITGNENLSGVLYGIHKSIIEGYITLAEAYEAEGWFDKSLELLQRVYDETGDDIIRCKLGITQASELVFREDYVIRWKDPAFESLIREYLDMESGDIHYDDVKMIERIEIWGRIIAKQDEYLMYSYRDDGFSTYTGHDGGKDGKIKTLADIEHFTSLSDLSVNYQEDLDISALADADNIDCLHRLTNISLIGNGMKDISAISELLALRSLSLGYNNIEDISAIALLIELQHLDISNNVQLSSVEPLRGLRKLSRVYISHIDTVDLSIFVGIPELQSMNLVNNKEVNYSILTQLPLKQLEITCDDLTFQIVKQLETLTELRIHGNGYWNQEEGGQVGYLTDISGIELLSNLMELDLLAQKCQDISPLSSLNITELEIALPIDCDLTALTKIESLERVVVATYLYNLSTEEKDNLIEEIQAILPHVQVTNG